jgi:hypothetical protein
MSEQVKRVVLVDECRSQRGYTLRIVGDRGLLGQAWLLSSSGKQLGTAIVCLQSSLNCPTILDDANGWAWPEVDPPR